MFDGPHLLPPPSGNARIFSLTTQVGQELDADRRPQAYVNRVLSRYLSEGQVLDGELGAQTLLLLLQALSRELEQLLRRKPGPYLLQDERHVSQRLWTKQALIGSDVSAATRNTAEAAIRRFASFTNIGPRSAWTTDPRTIARLLHLAELFSNALAMYRRVCKGQLVTIRSPVDFDAKPDDEDSEIGSLIAIRDRRAHQYTNLLGPLGQLSETSDVDGPIEVLAAEWSDPRNIVTAGRRWAERELVHGTQIPEHDALVTTGYLAGVSDLLTALEPFDDALLEQVGCRSTDILWMMHIFALFATRGEPQDVDVRVVTSGLLRASWPKSHDLWLLCNLIEEATTTKHTPTVKSLNRAADLLVSTPAAASLTDPLCQQPIIRTRGGFLYDSIAANGLTRIIVSQVELSEPMRYGSTRMFENQVHAALGRLGPQPLPSGAELKRGGRSLTDVDASVLLEGHLLIVVDCYSSPWTEVLDRGDYRNTRNRSSSLRAKLDAWDRKWRSIATGGPVPSLLGVDRVLPVVVTADPEWIDSSARSYWLDQDTPRMCTTAEISEWLTRGTDMGAHTIPLT